MSKWKFYYKKDINKETVGSVDADNIKDAYDLASKVKRLPLKDFKEIFIIAK
jgi:hypothetical protein